MAEEHRSEEVSALGYSWPAALGSLAAAIAIVVAATAAGALTAGLFDQWTGAGEARTFGAGEIATLAAARLAVFLVTFQAAAILLTVAIARAFDRGATSVLAPGPRLGGGRMALSYAGGLIGLAALGTAAVYAIDRNALLNDLLLFRDVLATRMWWGVALAAVIGAPIAEELLFRGLVYGVLRASPVGKVGGAVVTSAVWASIHAQYTAYGVTAIFLVGLYLAFVRERTGGVVAPMVCHGLYNATILAVLLTAPTRFLEPG